MCVCQLLGGLTDVLSWEMHGSGTNLLLSVHTVAWAASDIPSGGFVCVCVFKI